MDTAGALSCHARESATNPSGPTACKPAVPFPRRPGENDSALRAQRLQVHIEPVARRLVYGPRGAKDSNAMRHTIRASGRKPVHLLGIANPLLASLPNRLDAPASGGLPGTYVLRWYRGTGTRSTGCNAAGYVCLMYPKPFPVGPCCPSPWHVPQLYLPTPVTGIW